MLCIESGDAIMGEKRKEGHEEERCKAEEEEEEPKFPPCVFLPVGKQIELLWRASRRREE